MLDLCTWRCRIGLFHFKVRNVSVHARLVTPKARQVSEQPVTLSVADILVYATVAPVMLILLNSLLDIVFASVSTVDIFSTEGYVYQDKPSCVTMPWSDELERDGSSVIEGDVSRSVLPVGILVMLSLTNTAFVLRRLLLSGDVELNPGPNPSPNFQEHEKTIEPDNITSTNKEDCIAPDMAKQILLAIQQQNDQTTLIRNDLSAIRSELKDVNKKCDEINARCDRLEQENNKLANAVSDIVVDVGKLHEESSNSKDATENQSRTIVNLTEEINIMNDEIDRLESFSRKDNLRLFGIPQTNTNEDYDMCATAVVQALNDGSENKTWSEDDIIRAHRIGQGNPKPMIVKFRKWKDKMELIKNKDLREKLDKHGIRVANDLTKRQAAMVAQARRDGKSAYFVRGVITVGPKRTPQRSYAEVATASTGTDGEAERDRCQQVPTGGGESPRHVTSDGSHRTSLGRDEGFNSTRNVSVSSRGGSGGGDKLGRGRGAARADRGDTRSKTQQAGMESYLSTTSRPNTPDSDRRALRSGSSSK